MPARPRLAIVRETRSVRLALAAIAACTTAAVVYAILRLGQALLFPAVDPALVIYSEHSGFFWRVWTALYAGGMLGFGALFADPKRVASILRRAVVPAGVAIALQGVLVP
jgi:hypothetical protein